VPTLTTLDSEELIQLFELSDWQEFALRVGDCELFLSKNRDAGVTWSAHGAHATVPAAAAASSQPSAHVIPSEHSGTGQGPVQVPDSPGKHQAPVGCSVVTAPSLGTFHRAAQLGAAALVEVDSQVGKDTELCRIEVMKRFTTLRAGVAGTVREVYARDGELVEFAQPLFLIDTHA
jgi:acetyl-CoA carboxylase biotin carboxyl carrier protein